MVSSIASSTLHHLISPVVSMLGLGSNFKIRPRVSFLLVKKDRVLGYKELKETRTGSGFSCEGYLDCEAELALEREILVFMKNSRNPNEFPTKKELLDAGRVDLVNAITKTGGWLALGWDYSDDENDLESNDFVDVRELQTRVESFQQRHDACDPSSGSFSSSHEAASPSGRPLEMVADDEDKGAEGILSRLKKHRSLSFDIRLEKNRYGAYASSKDNGGLADFRMSTDVGKLTAQGTCIIPGRHFSDFQAAEIDYGKEDSKDKTLAIQHDSQLQERHQEINPDQIRSRLQHMQLELSSALRSLRSKSETLNLEVLELGIVVHSIVIGLGVGASNDICTIKPLVAALCFHQMFEGMGLGGCILQAEYKKIKKAAMVFFFSITTPFGIALGIGLSKTYKENSPSALITVGLLNASSAGLLIYMAMVDLLAADFMGPKLQGSIKLQIKSYVAVLLGAGGMSLMAKWA